MAIIESYLAGENSTALINKTIGQYLESIVEQYADHEAIVVTHQGIRWNYREYLQQIDRLATGLLALGVEPGDRVGIWSPNNIQWSLTQFATAKIGAIMVCINPAYGPYELEYALKKVGCRVLITASEFKKSNYLEMLQQLAPELAGAPSGKLRANKLPHLEIIIRMGNDVSLGMLNFDEVCNLGTDVEYEGLHRLHDSLRPEDPINIQFTSGTTGRPKGAVLSHHNILNNAYQVGLGMSLTAQDRLCIPVPLYHCFGMVLGNLTCMAHGATAIFPGESFDPIQTLATVEIEKCTALHGVPTMFIAMLEDSIFESFDLSSLRTGVMAGATCPVELMKRVENDMHMTNITVGYGQTETSPLNHMSSMDTTFEKRVSTVGRVVPHLEVKIINEQGKTVPIDNVGELCCRGYAVMQGYWDDEERTQETIDSEGWLYSGDLALMDSEGYVQIVGRIKDMIIRGGENIYPREVEEFLYTHPYIQDVAVFGVDDAKYGEEVCVWIQTQEGKELTDEEIRTFCNGKISHFKIPRYIRFVDSYPMTVTGKVQKYKMSEQMNKELTY